MSRLCLKYIIAFLVLIPVFFLTATPIHAAKVIDSATLNGSTSVTVLPSASITAQVNATLTGGGAGDDWGSTSYQIGSGSATCVNHANITNSGSFSQSFTITAPSSDGTYDVSFIVWRNDACSSDPSPTFTLTGGIIVASPTPTPGPGTPTPTPTPGGTATPTSSSSSDSSSGTSTYYPSVTLNTYLPNPTNKIPLTFTGTTSIDQGTVQFVEYSVTNGAGWEMAQMTGGNFSFTTPNLAEGAYTVKVRAKSGAGVYTQESSYASQSITIAQTPPVVTLDKITPNPTGNQTPTIKGIATSKLIDIEKIEVSIDGGKSWKIAKRSGKSFSLTTNLLEDGNYSVIARAIDSAGNTGKSDTLILVVDTIPPIIGGAMQSVGPQILIPDKNGVIAVVSGVETTIAMSMKGGVTEAVIRSGSDSFKLQQKEGTNLWVGKIKFDAGGEKELAILAIDGAGNATERKFNTVSVENSGVIKDKKTGQIIENAEVSIYFFEPISKTWTIWEGASYGQINPQKTNSDGVFGFILPPGKYYLEVKESKYRSLQSEIITVSETSIVNYMLVLSPKPKIEFNLPFIGRVVFTIPSFGPPETFLMPDSSGQKLPEALDATNESEAIAPNFSLPDLENKEINLSGFKGKKLLLSFISSWSSLSMEQALFLSEAYSKLSEDQTMLVISLQETPATTKTLIQNGNYSFPTVADKDGITAAGYNITILPRHVFIDKDGKINDSFTGILTTEELIERLSNVP